MPPIDRNALAAILANIDQIIEQSKMIARAARDNDMRMDARVYLEEMLRARKAVESQLKDAE